ncbi:MAG: type II secretion system inner membrane protein GspF [Candidatus Wallbacteria bacterium]|nr:type II secretion system inner membrane protein GspF [Candidatus Wallbacteria bacterium]
MGKFAYKARSRDGKTISGEMEADSKDLVVTRLREKGFFVTQCKEKTKEITLFQRKVKSYEVAVFARQFATMIGAGVPLVKCLGILHEQTENPRFRQVLARIRSDVEGGATFSKALERCPEIFSELFVDLVRAGEAGGILDEILNRLANYLESSEQLKSKVKGALTYPIVVATIAVGVVFFLLTFVLPNFKNIFQGMGDAALPLPTRVLLGVSDFLSAYFVFILMGLAAMAYGLKRFFCTKQGRRIWDTNLLRMPVIGILMRKVAIAKFTRTLGTLVSSGVPILQALEVTAATAGNVVISDAIHKTRVSIREGESIAEPLKASTVFPPMVVQMIAVGEETGELDGMLIKIAEFYEQEVDTAIKGLTSIIEPVIIVFMGVVVGGIVMAIFLPMLEIINQAS